MALSILARAAVATSVASALTLEMGANDGGFSMKSDIPRSVVQAGQEDGCGSNITGYMLVGPGMVWSDARRGTAASVTDCRQKCDQAKNCIAFTARSPRSGKLQCNQYMGLVKKYDPRGMSYSKCMKGMKCAEGSGYLGFQFSHQGSWKNGEKDASIKALGHCSKACRHDRSCVGFTHRHTKDGVGECYLYKNNANLAGPKRDMRANTWSKCAVAEKEATSSGSAPSLPQFLATAGTSCNKGFVASSKGWWWKQYDRVTEVADWNACADACSSAEKCVSFVYRPTDKKAECYTYHGVNTKLSPTTYAFTKCPTAAQCDETGDTHKLYNISTGYFKFSHHGNWEGGTSFNDVKLQGCSIICYANPACTALSWQSEGSICSTYSFKTSSSSPSPAAGAEGYSKCAAADEPKL